ncbi:SdpI family protein [Clostridium aminobutyricum]|uniref:SdpI family protein n=1 Tax=Clostridium aminobutyricum TaxID=33953 RepID=A0A939D8E3_CLOAM|nr:SdpI family protein [Clostridium aminobutyricum]MBN7772608.1 SdpI family protein [Clostridium aminobutyricum]
MKYLFCRYNLKTWVLFAIATIVACIALPVLPEQIPMHFNVAGEIDDYGSKYTIFLAPAVIFIFQIIAEVCRRIDPKRDNYESFKNYYYQIIFIVGLIMFVIEVITIAAAFGKDVHMATIMPVMMGALFVFLGNMMPKFKHNYMVGIKTSWTLASEQVWYETHRFAGKIWVIGGLVMVLTAFLPDFWKFIAFLTVTLLMVIIPVVFSYMRYKNR